MCREMIKQFWVLYTVKISVSQPKGKYTQSVLSATLWCHKKADTKPYPPLPEGLGFSKFLKFVLLLLDTLESSQRWDLKEIFSFQNKHRRKGKMWRFVSVSFSCPPFRKLLFWRMFGPCRWSPVTWWSPSNPTSSLVWPRVGLSCLRSSSLNWAQRTQDSPWTTSWW